MVAAASIIARATWLAQMRKIEEIAGCSIPKGSGTQAKEVARRIYQKVGEERMKEFCKLHFKTAVLKCNLQNSFILSSPTFW